MKIALGQINTTVGAVGGNVDTMLAYADRARAAGADLIVFHELCIPGYPPKGLAENRDFVSANLEAFRRLRQKCRGIGVVCGYIEGEGKSGKSQVYNAAALVHDGEVVVRRRKNVLSAFSGFDERIHFTAGKGGAVGNFKGVGIGLAISEDAWSDKDFWEKGRRKRTLPRLKAGLVGGGARLLIVIGSSPLWAGKSREREKAARAVALRYGVPVVCVNQVGGNDSLIFDGGSFVVAADGRIVARAKRFEEDLVIADLDAACEAEAPEQDEVKDIRSALVLGVRDFARKCGFEKAILGLSGGIDSAVVACIAVEALGKENVLALVMPSMYSSRAAWAMRGRWRKIWASSLARFR